MAVSSITVNPNPIQRGRNATFTINHDSDAPSFNAGSVGRIFLYRTSGTSQIRSESFIGFTRVSLRQFTFAVPIPADTNRIIFWDLGRRSFDSFVDPPPQITFNAPSRYSVREFDPLTIDSNDFFTGHTSLSFQSGISRPSWVSISGTDIVIARAPDVNVDTDFNITLTAANSGGTLNGRITVRVTYLRPLGIQQISSPLNIIVDTPWSLDVTITGDPDSVEVVGRLYGADHEWNKPKLRIFHTFNELVSGGTFRIVVSQGLGTPIEQEVIFNVVPSAPIIPAITLPPIIKGDEYFARIPVFNVGGENIVESLWAGLREDGEENVVILTGDIGDGPYGVDEAEATIRAVNSTGSVSRTFRMPIQDINRDYILTFQRSSEILNAVDKTAGMNQSGSQTITPDIAYTSSVFAQVEENVNIISIAVYRNEIYLMNLRVPGEVFVFGKTDVGDSRLRRNFTIGSGRIAFSPPNPSDPLIDLPPFIIEVHDNLLYVLYSTRQGVYDSLPARTIVECFDMGDGIPNEYLIESNDPGYSTSNVTPRISERFRGGFDLAVDDSYVYVLESLSGNNRLHRYNRTTGVKTGSFLTLGGVDSIVNVAVDDDWLYYSNSVSGVVQIFDKSSLNFNGSSTPIRSTRATLSIPLSLMTI